MVAQDAAAGTLALTVDVAGAAPDTLFDYWTQPALLQAWWPQVAEIDARVGGAYHLAWPAMNWHLRGRYTRVERGRALAFTWAWDHEPAEVGAKEVRIDFEPLAPGGTRLTVTHGPYDESDEDQVRRAGHLEGWSHFLAQLQALLAASGSTRLERWR